MTRRPFLAALPPSYVMTEMTTLEMARLAYSRACETYHHAIVNDSSFLDLNRARVAYNQARAILRAAERLDASA